MSNLRNMTLRETVPLIAKLYESFGVKSMIFLKDNEWINIVTVIQFTRRKVEDLSNEYRLLEERLGKIDYNYFKIVFQAKKTEEFSNVLTELENGYLKIGELRARLLVENPKKWVDQKIDDYSYASRLGEYAEFTCYGSTLIMPDNPQRILSIFGISASKLGLRDFNDLARSWLGLDSFQTSVNIHIVFPVYAKVIKIQYQGGNEIRIPIKIDQKLFDNSKIWLTRKGQGDMAPLLERIEYDPKACTIMAQNGYVYVSLAHRFSAISQNDRISVALLHNELELLDWREELIYQRLPENPLLGTFALFDAGKKMENHLLNPNDDEEFVASVSWLLEIIEILSLKLGQGETVRENHTEKGSADIIAYDKETNEMLVIDCTIAVPSETKIDKIRNTAEYISRKIEFPVKAVIFTAKTVTAAKQLGRKCNVKIVDNTDLEKIMGHHEKGHNYPARKIILND